MSNPDNQPAIDPIMRAGFEAWSEETGRPIEELIAEHLRTLEAYADEPEVYQRHIDSVNSVLQKQSDASGE